MKTAVTLIMLAIFFTMAASCSQSNVSPNNGQAKTSLVTTDSLIGQWKLTKIIFGEPLPNGPTLTTDVDDQVYEFTADKRFTLYKKGQRVEEGAYAKTVNAIDKLNKEYIINFLTDSTISLYSLSADQKELTLSTRMPNYPRIVDAPTYVFTKQE